MIDELEARDEVCQMFNDAWQLVNWAPIGGVMPQIIWTGRIADEPPPVDAPYVRFTMTPVDARQASLSGETSAKKWDNAGIISVQSFGPQAWANGYDVAEYVAIMAKRVFQGKATPNGMWFRNCRTNRIEPSGGWHQFNTLIEYQFNELR